MATMVASGSQFPASDATQDKGSRNKRKFRADPPPPLPLVPCSECNANANKGFVGLNGWKMGCQSMEPFNTEGSVDGNLSSTQKHACCNTHGFCNFCKAQQEHLNSFKCFAQLSGAKGVQSENRELGFGYEDFTNGERSQEERDLEELQEADWSDITESQLEELLLSNLDTIYKSAIKKIASYGYTEDVAQKAVLKYGRCYGSKDTLSNIVDNALAYLRNTHETDSKDHFFEDLQQLEKYILAEMVCVLREVRPFFSNGDAMWCLLICDMNVAHACAMDEDALNNFNKDSVSGNSPVSSSVESKPEPSSSLMPPAVSTNMPVFHNNANHLSHPVVQNPQALNSPMPFVTGVPAFPMQGYTMAGNMASNPCKHEDTSGPNISGDVQSEFVHPCCRTVDLKHDHDLQIRAVASSDHFQESSACTAEIGTASEPGSHACEATAEDCILSMAQPFQKAEKFISEATQLEDNMKNNPTNLKRDSGALFSPTILTDKLDHVENTGACLLNMSPIEEESHKGDKANSDTSYRTASSSCIAFSGGTNPQQNSENFPDAVQTDLLIGKPSQSVDPELSMRDCRIDPETVDDASSFAVAGTELSLTLASVGDGGAEVVNGCTSTAEEAADSNYDTVSLDQIFGGNGSQDRKDEMLVKMFHRVRELETQLQEWTEWAQQKVMQAARRLSKDKAELKALRQEKEEAARLKKEKQALEESTMKKLSEMENALRKASGQVERANAAVRRLEAENKEVRHEMEAAKLSAAESAAACQEVSKREKKTLKKFQAWERQKAILQEELAAEKRKLTHLQHQLVQAKERQLQIEVRWRQEEKAKDEAIMRAQNERRAKEQCEAAAKRKEEALCQKAETDSQRYRDDVQRLEREIAQLRLITESSKLAAMRWGSDCTFASPLSDTDSIQVLKQTNAWLFSEIAELQDLSRKDVQRDRECVMCLSEEMSVVFLPCAHQVVCAKCNELHEKQGMKDCPSCRTPIEKRVCVYSVNS
eukprot:Gb_03171 [translate_table: standard]